MCIPTRDEVRAAYRQGEEAAIQLFDCLAWELQTLQDQLNKNNKKQQQAPSSDGLKKPAPKARENQAQQNSCVDE